MRISKRVGGGDENFIKSRGGTGGGRGQILENWGWGEIYFCFLWLGGGMNLSYIFLI